MAWMVNDDRNIPWRTMGATVLQASTSITATTASSGVFVGKGLLMLEINVSLLNLGSGFDTIIFWAQRNTIAAPSTWVEIGALPIGDATGIGLAQGVDVYPFPVYNDGDNQIRLNVYHMGSASRVTYSANAYPLRDRVVG